MTNCFLWPLAKELRGTPRFEKSNKLPVTGFSRDQSLSKLIHSILNTKRFTCNGGGWSKFGEIALLV